MKKRDNTRKKISIRIYENEKYSVKNIDRPIELIPCEEEYIEDYEKFEFISVCDFPPMPDWDFYNNQHTPFDYSTSINLIEKVQSILCTLTEREQLVLNKRFGIGGIGYHPGYTFQDVGDMFGVTKTRIRQIEEKALRKLRHASRSKFLKSFVCDDSIPEAEEIQKLKNISEMSVLECNLKDIEYPSMVSVKTLNERE